MDNEQAKIVDVSNDHQVFLSQRIFISESYYCM